MTNPDFGKQLRTFRLQCSGTKNRKLFSQQQLGEALDAEIGVRYTGAAVSDWERGASLINASDRLLLISLIKILKKRGGITTISDADNLLEAGNYRALNQNEINEIFPDEIAEVISPSITHSKNQQVPGIKFLLGNVLFNSPEGFQQILDDAKEGPPPAWPRVVVSLINKTTNRWNVFHVLKILIWVWIWALSYFLIAPSLQWKTISFQTMFIYACGTLIIPPLIGAMVNTRDREFWKEQNLSNSLTIRLYVHQGAYVGFHLGYFILLPFALAQNQFGFHTTALTEFIKMLIPILISYAGAQLVPYNLWRAYNRLHLKDGHIFFIFTLLGPIWAWFFLEFNNSIGLFTLLIAATLLTAALAIRYRQKGISVIPVLWVIIFYSFILIFLIASIFIR